MSARQGIPFVVSAPSGTGKTTVCKQVVERADALVFSISHTTRPIRGGEVDGRDYHFVDTAEFERMAAADEFLEWAVYNDNRYGTSWAAIDAPLAAGTDVILEIEVQGAGQVRERRRDARFVCLLPPSFAELRRRLESRGTDAPEVIERRLGLARREFEALRDFDYAVVNDDLATAVEQVLEIIAAERSGATEAVRERFAPTRVAARVAEAPR